MSVSVITQHVCHIAGMVVDGIHNQCLDVNSVCNLMYDFIEIKSINIGD